MSDRHATLAFAVFAAVFSTSSLAAHVPEGRRIVEETCIACHGTGVDGAPRIGDSRAWEPRARQGLSSLTQHALDGVRAMPPHGGKMSLTDLEIRRAIAYMVNQSGGHWTEPLDRSHPDEPRTGMAIVRMQCIKCHEAGLNGAPRIGERAAWIPRARNGFDGLVRSAIQGHGAMPARGGMADLTDVEMRKAITYMFQTSVNGRRLPVDASGRQVAAEACLSCHETGRKGAPRVGDRAAWQGRAVHGLSQLCENALSGKGNMPAHGGDLILGELEIKRAIAWMVNESGGHWVEPVARIATIIPTRSGEDIVNGRCARCHEKGLEGAPRIDDYAAWEKRAKDGLDSLTRSAIHGHGGMPKRGGMASLTDDELRSAVGYLAGETRRIARR